MKREKDKNIAINELGRDLKVDRPRTRAYIKQETNDSKESLECALYSPVKNESFSLEIAECENSGSAETVQCKY